MRASRARAPRSPAKAWAIWRLPLRSDDESAPATFGRSHRPSGRMRADLRAIGEDQPTIQNSHHPHLQTGFFCKKGKLTPSPDRIVYREFLSYPPSTHSSQIPEVLIFLSFWLPHLKV